MSTYAKRIEPRLDAATGLPVCVVCEASLAGRTPAARFCSHACRSTFHNTPEKRAAGYPELNRRRRERRATR